MQYTELITVNKEIIIGIAVVIISTTLAFNQSFEIMSMSLSSQKNFFHEKTSIRDKHGKTV
ncbi:MAG: hypothetical protein WBV92_03255 [Nitrosotalea sp.]